MVPQSDLPTKEDVAQFMSEDRGELFVPIRTSTFSIRALFQAIDILLAHDVKSISSLYKARTQPRSWIWQGFTIEDLRHNVRTVLLNLVDEYKSFLDGNCLVGLKSSYCNDNIAVVFMADFARWNAGAVAWFAEFWVDNTDRKLSQVSFLEDTHDLDAKTRSSTIGVNGIERRVIRSAQHDAAWLFRQFPLQSVIYDMLTDDLNETYKNR